MTRPVLGLIAPLALSLVLLAAPAAVPALAAGGGGGGGGGGGTDDPRDMTTGKPPQPTASHSNTTAPSTHKGKKAKQSFFDDPLSSGAIAQPMPRSTSATTMPRPSRSSRRSVTTILPMWRT